MVLVVAAALTACETRTRFDTVNARYWVSGPERPVFPEISDAELKVERVNRDAVRLGVAFSGGGTRSASATLGQLRALHKLGWHDRINYIAAVSGGSWAAVPYTYVPKNIDGSDPLETKFLGRLRMPDELSDALLTDDTERGAFADAVPSTVIAPRFVWEALKFRLDEIYARTIGGIFLADFGLNERDQFFSWNDTSVGAILGRNAKSGDGKTYLEKDDFLTVERSRPFLVVGGTLISRPKQAEEDIYHFEMTPLYVGVPGRAQVGARCDKIEAGKAKGCEVLGERIVGTRDFKLAEALAGNKAEVHTRWIGGGYVEPFAYDSDALAFANGNGSAGGMVHARIGLKRYRFTLSDVVGTSGAAPQEILSGFGWDTLGFPEFRHWPISSAYAETPHLAQNAENRAYEYSHGDGGHLDNLGVMPLLARGVDKIIAFINTPVRFRPYGEQEARARVREQTIYSKVLVDDLVAMFRPIDAKPFNTVFADGERALKNIYDAYRADRAAGRPLIHCQDYQTRENTLYGIKPYKPTICWVYLERAGGWLKGIGEAAKQGRLKPETCRELVLGRGDYRKFPHYGTFFQRGLKVIGLKRFQVNALAHLSAWSVLAGSGEIAAAVGGLAPYTESLGVPSGGADPGSLAALHAACGG